MVSLRRAEERGASVKGSLESSRSFSFAEFYDERYMGFGALRVLNEERLLPGALVDTHLHRNKEILTYVVDGALAQEDSIGVSTVLRAGELQVLSAGTGLRHATRNPSRNEAAHYVELWLDPREGGEPALTQRNFGAALARGGLVLAASPDGRAGSLAVRQDLLLTLGRAVEPLRTQLKLEFGRRLWVQVLKGTVKVERTKLGAGDGVAIEGVSTVRLQAEAGAEFLVAELA